MSLLTGLGVAWAVLTALLFLLVVYRSVIGMHEDDHLFLDEAEKVQKTEQEQLSVKMARVRPYIRALSAGSVALILVMAGIWLYRGLALRG